MKLLYEMELTEWLAQSNEEVVAFAKKLIESNNAISWQKANELSHLLRRNNRHDMSVIVSRLMYEKDPTIDKLNLYFVAVVDQGSIEEIRNLHSKVDEYIKQNGGIYQKHLFATWLKAANRISDNNMFDYVYNIVPADEKIENSYIICQYYVYLNRNSRYAEVKEHYEKELAANIQNLKYVKRYYTNACSRMGYPSNDEIISPEVKTKKPITISDNSPKVEGAGTNKRVFLVYGNQPTSLEMIKYVLNTNSIEFIDLAEEVSGGTILQKFESHASESRFAIILLTPADHVVKKDSNGIEENIYYPRQNVVLEWGYFLGKLGKNNIAVLLQEEGRKLHRDFIVPSDMLGTEHISMSHSNWIKKLTQRLKNSGIIAETPL